MSRSAPSRATSPIASAARPWALRRYLVAVWAAGGLLLAYLVSGDGLAGVRTAPATFAVLALLLVGGELTPTRVQRRGESVRISTSTMFAFALLLAFGTGPAVLTLCLASVAVDLWSRRAPVKVAFNAAVYSLALGLAGLAYQSLAPLPLPTDRPFAVADFAPLVCAGAVFVVVNVALLVVAVSLHGGYAARLQQFRSSSIQVLEGTVSMVLSPIVVVVADHSLWLAAVLALPLAGVYRSARLVVTQEHEALHDTLTGLANRVLLQERVEQALLQARRSATSIAVMLVDLDRFKEVNDTLGHQAGDELLKAVAARLEGAVRETDTVGRLGGDEFAVLATGVHSPADATDVAERIVAALEAPFVVRDVALEVLGSTGVALSPIHGEDFETLLKRADVAMYRAKSTRSGYQLYRAEPGDFDEPEAEVLDELRRALAEGKVAVHYRPKATLDGQEVTGVEALAAWARPGHGPLAHPEVVALAERAGVTRALTRHVVDRALAHWRLWRDDGVAVPVAVNLAARDLQDRNLADEIATALRRHAVPPDQLQIEVTENVISADPRCARATLAVLAAKGVRIAVDDFGRGASSIGLLSRLPLAELKIAGSFVRAMAVDPHARVAVRSVVALGRTLGVEVTAEGLDAADARPLLADAGCGAGQGDLVGEALSPAELACRLRAGRVDRTMV